QLIVTEREEFIARTKGTRAFPWRIFVIAENDIELADNDMVYRLASPSRVADTSWIRPGKVAWDWWNDWNIHGVDFRAGINNDTYKYYIDFAAERGIEYVILDEGWAVNKKADLFQVIPEIDLQELVDYGRERNVGIVLWAGFYAVERDMERVCKHFSEMGVKGFKVDFMDRDDQKIADFVYRLAETAARYHLFLDLHGFHKPAGLQRTYPNVLNFEGVFGLEQMKWSDPDTDQVTYDVTIPYIRMLAGPMDYTQGAMRNATRGNYRPVNSEAMSQGTRCRQLAEYVIFESPFNMLCDAPTNYLREAECTQFIATVPTTWDETRGLDGRVGEYVTIARRKGDVWYVGGMTDWSAREFTLDLGFLGEGAFSAEVFRDGINADRAACDYKREVVEVPADRKMTLNTAPGGGFAIRITRK
ncbi:MAG TPA: glycoside hydrolase family 97 protein, partial [Candidatus Alistipes intestinipullorum]|nr:glycoside hydrolase family 97 protein [Candidatus Alistipes intestinipullorum]